MSGARKCPAAEVVLAVTIPTTCNLHSMQIYTEGSRDRDCAARDSTYSQQGVDFDTDIPVEPACTCAVARGCCLWHDCQSMSLMDGLGSSRGPEQLPEEARRRVGHDQGTARGDHDSDMQTDRQHGPLKTYLRVGFSWDRVCFLSLTEQYFSMLGLLAYMLLVISTGATTPHLTIDMDV